MELQLSPDPNFTRRDRWFRNLGEVVLFLHQLRREHADESPQMVSAALLQARKNLVMGTQRQLLRAEVARLLQLLAASRQEA